MFKHVLDSCFGVFRFRQRQECLAFKVADIVLAQLRACFDIATCDDHCDLHAASNIVGRQVASLMRFLQPLFHFLPDFSTRHLQWRVSDC